MNSLSFRTFNCFNVSAKVAGSFFFLNNCHGPLFIYSAHFLKWSSQLRKTVDLPLPGGKITIDVPDCNSLKTLRSFSNRIFGILSVRLIVARIVSASSFSRSFTVLSIVAVITLLCSALK